MLRFALVFAILALIAGVFGFYGLEGQLAFFAKVLLFVFLVLAFFIGRLLVFGRRAAVLRDGGVRVNFSTMRNRGCARNTHLTETSLASKRGGGDPMAFMVLRMVWMP